jgi:hypothetical protein
MNTQSSIYQLTRAYGTAVAVLSLYMPANHMARCETQTPVFSGVSSMINRNKDVFVSHVVSKSNCDTVDLLRYQLSKKSTFPVIKKLFVRVRKTGRIKYQPVGDNNGFV